MATQKTKILRLPPALFESVRQSVDSLPADGDTFQMDLVDARECRICAESHSARLFGIRLARLTKQGPVTIQKITE